MNSNLYQVLNKEQNKERKKTFMHTLQMSECFQNLGLRIVSCVVDSGTMNLNERRHLIQNFHAFRTQRCL